LNINFIIVVFVGGAACSLFRFVGFRLLLDLLALGLLYGHLSTGNRHALRKKYHSL
jgi:hypothetical protein